MPLTAFSSSDAHPTDTVIGSDGSLTAESVVTGNFGTGEASRIQPLWGRPSEAFENTPCQRGPDTPSTVTPALSARLFIWLCSRTSSAECLGCMALALFVSTP